MNNDLISREALREAFYKRIFYFNKSSWDEANALIENAPTVEARPEGEWIPVYPLTDICSICNGEALDFNDYPYKSKFCPHCGAKMKGGEAVAANIGDN